MNPLDTPSGVPEMFDHLPSLIDLMAGAMMTRNDKTLADADPQWEEDRDFGGSLSRKASPPPDDGDHEFIAAARRWWHPTVTVALVVFMWQQYQSWNAKDAERDRDITVMKERVRELLEANIAQDKARNVEIDNLTKRLDIQRKAIDDLNKELFDHAVNDDRQFQRKPPPSLR